MDTSDGDTELIVPIMKQPVTRQMYGPEKIVIC